MSEGKRGEALEWFNDARVSIAGKVAAIRQFHSEVSDSVFDVLDQLDRWWNRWEGSVIAREGQNLAWVRANKLRDYPMPPADIPLIPHLIDLLM